jgi:hypothetical protein
MSPWRRLARTHFRLRSSAVCRYAAARSRRERNDLGRGEFAVVLGNLLVGSEVRQFRGDRDRLLPVLFKLIDLEQVALGAFGQFGVAQPVEGLLGAIEQACLEIVLSEFGQCLQFQIVLQILAFDKILVHPDGAVGLPATAKQAAERKVEFDGLRIDFDGFNKSLDGAVRLLVEQKS